MGKLSGSSVIMKVVSVAGLTVAGVLSLAFAAAGMGFTDPGEAAPSYSSSDSSHLSDECGIPAEYMEVFEKATAEYDVPPALIAAIFYAGEHGNSWPDIKGPWKSGPNTNSGTAKGPFQFKDATWQRYGLGGNVQDINDAARGAANMFKQNIAKGKGNEEHNIKNAIENYNSDKEYVEKVYKQYLVFLKCSTNSENGNLFKSLKEVEARFGTTEEEIREHLTTVTFMGKKVTVNKIMIEDLKKIEGKIKNFGYNITRIDSYNFRDNVNNSGSLSAHSFGLALDINPATNPNLPRPGDSKERDPSACKHDIPDKVAQAFEDNNFFWGAKFKNVCDSMHFQYGGNWD